MWVSESGNSSSLGRTACGSAASGSRSSIRACSWGASRATTLPRPQRAAPESCPARSRSSTCAPRVTNHRPLSGAASASAMPCTSAKALAVARFASTAMSAAVASGPWPSCATRCTTPDKVASGGRPSISACQDSRRSISTAAATTPSPPSAGAPALSGSSTASTTLWFSVASCPASAVAVPPPSAARTHTPSGKGTSAGPWATITPRSGRPAASEGSTPRISAPVKPVSASA